MNINRYSLFIFLSVSSLLSYSQIPDSSLQISPQVPEKFYSKVDKKISSIDNHLARKSVEYLAKFQRQERKLRQKLEKLNTGNATNVFTSADEKYNEFSDNIKNKTAGATKIICGEYNPYLDSLGSSLSFLKQFKGTRDKAEAPLASLGQLQNKLQQSEKIKEFIAERKNQIKELLSKYSKIPGTLKNQYSKLNKTAYYYSAQVKEYKEMLKDPDKMETKALSIIRELPAFQKFWQKNSYMAQLFPIPANYGTIQALNGLQTNSQVQQQFAQQLGITKTTAGNPTQYLQQQLSQAQSSLNTLKDKVTGLGATTGTGDKEVPDFKPNSQKTKSLFQRLEYGINIQNASQTSFLPAMSEIALTIGYRFSDKATAGIGSSYKLGLGHAWNHIHFSSQGAGFRSYFDAKAKGSIWISGGLEYNYLQSFRNLQELHINVNLWQRSALAGLTKKYKVGKKDGNMQLLYDFLASRQIPRAQPVKFRVGYNF